MLGLFSRARELDEHKKLFFGGGEGGFYTKKEEYGRTQEHERERV